MARQFALLVAALLLACSRGETQVTPREKPVAQPSPRFVDLTLPKVRLDSAQTRDLAHVVNATFRVRPDRRFLMAVTDVHELLTGQRVIAQISFANGQWVVAAGGREMGTLPELPTFRDGLDFATRIASRLENETHPSSPIDTSSFYATSLFEKVKNGDPRRNALALAEAAALINAQTTDALGLADPLRARGLALLAIARAQGAKDTDDLAGLLADSFGYEREARVPQRLSATAKAHLDARAAVRRAPPGRHYDISRPFLESLPALALPLFVENIEMDESSVAHAAARVIAAEVAGDKQLPGLTAATLISSEDTPGLDRLLSTFELSITPRSKELASRAFPEEVVRSHYDAVFHSALFEIFQTMLESVASEEASRSVVSNLKEANAPVSQQVHDWMTMVVAAKYERGGGVPADVAVARVPLLGAAARARLLREYSSAVGPSDPKIRKAVQQLFPQLDSRPAEMIEAGRFANHVLGDPFRRELYLGTAIDRAPSLEDAGFRAWYYARIGHEARLREIVESTDARPVDRAVALESLGELPGADHAYVTRRFESLLRDTGYSGYSNFAKYINGRRDWKTKERVARGWFSEKRNASSIEDAYYASSLAHALEQQRRYQEAWKIVEPHVQVWSHNVIESAVSLLERRGEVEEALDLGKQMIERYPGVSSRATVAAVLWRRGRYAEAAELFDRRHALATSTLRSDLPPEFIEAFRGASAANAAAAIEALSRTVDAYVIDDIVTEMQDAGLHETAFAMVDRLTALAEWKANTPDGSGMHVNGWRAMREWRGTDAATAWLSARVPDAAALQFVVIAYQQEEYDLIWAYGSPRPDPNKSIEILTLLAASLIHARAAEDDPRRLALIEKVRALGDKPGTLLPVVKYLLGMIGEEDFLRWPRDADGRVTAAYFVGLKSAAEGDYDKALPWLIAASEGRETNPPRAWAVGMLWRWAQANQSWKEIAASGTL